MNHMIKRARRLRKNMTDAERKLWRSLRNHNCLGLHFRRQSPIGHYIVDFVCHEKKIIIEVDGGQHLDQAEYDRHRDQWLTDQGFRIVRFWNTEVLLNFQGVLQKIYMELSDPSP